MGNYKTHTEHCEKFCKRIGLKSCMKCLSVETIISIEIFTKNERLLHEFLLGFSSRDRIKTRKSIKMNLTIVTDKLRNKGVVNDKIVEEKIKKF